MVCYSVPFRFKVPNLRLEEFSPICDPSKLTLTLIDSGRNIQIGDI
jgi:hypothetical protein